MRAQLVSDEACCLKACRKNPDSRHIIRTLTMTTANDWETSISAATSRGKRRNTSIHVVRYMASAARLDSYDYGTQRRRFYTAGPDLLPRRLRP